jgi:nucleotide-binding universal stress UspA family protein
VLTNSTNEESKNETMSHVSTRILLPIKFSHVTENALAMALKMAKCCKARLHILHVLDHRLQSPEVTDGQIAEFTREAERQFEKRYRPLLGGFHDFYFNCWEGDIAHEVAKFAGSIGADFIVLGCHVRGDKPSFTRLGEVALAIFQWSPCPVMLVPCELHRRNNTVK